MDSCLSSFQLCGTDGQYTLKEIKPPVCHSVYPAMSILQRCLTCTCLWFCMLGHQRPWPVMRTVQRQCLENAPRAHTYTYMYICVHMHHGSQVHVGPVSLWELTSANLVDKNSLCDVSEGFGIIRVIFVFFPTFSDFWCLWDQGRVGGELWLLPMLPG